MNDQEPKSNIIDFIQIAKDKYYGPYFRELPDKQKTHLDVLISHDEDLKKKKLEADHG